MEHLYIAAYLVPAVCAGVLCFVVCCYAHDDAVLMEVDDLAFLEEDDFATPPIPLETIGDYVVLAGLSTVAGLMWPLAAPAGLYLIWREMMR